jgi:uncharacterized phage protein (TIGR01671 family)
LETDIGGSFIKQTTMQREIKFRAWDGAQMMYDIFHEPGDMQVTDINEVLNSMDFVCMQFTGIQDRKGRDIYEGDILHRHLGIFWVVKFKDGRWIADELKPMAGLYLDYNQFSECQIIGNIFEHTEPLQP